MRLKRSQCLGRRFLVALAILCSSTAASAHDLSGDPTHAHPDAGFRSPEALVPKWFLAQAPRPTSRAATRPVTAREAGPTQAAPFAAFGPKVAVRSDDRFLYVESDGLPTHPMMVGITAWQQQVPLPQSYTGANAWRIPLSPRPAKEPASIKDRFLRGAIAIAANGIPIFNPQNNRGEISADIGELDRWGGHCGRADDYHYHAAPLHLQTVLGTTLPIGYALDGYALFGLTEPDGTSPTGLDAFNGHSTPALGYHYHASTRYPFVNGGFHGEVTEADGQVDPQPRARPVRPSLTALRGAKITGFEAVGSEAHRLTYTVDGETRSVQFAAGPDGTFPFEFQDGRGGTVKQVYTAREGGGRRDNGEPRPDGGRARPRQRDEQSPVQRGRPRVGGREGASAPASWNALKRPDPSFVLTSPDVADGGALPTEYTGDGAGITPPLAWRGAPPGTQGYVLIMDHLAPGDEVKCSWTLWDIPADVTALPKNSTGIGRTGTSFKGKSGYEPPRSQGPGAKTYVLTVYALSGPLRTAGEVDRETLLSAMKDKVLASASLNVVHTRGAVDEPAREPRRNGQANQGRAPGRPDRPSRGPDREGGADPKGLVKPTLADTTKANIYADNWFVLYLNGKLTAVDSIDFLPHNVVSVDVLPEYPLTIAVLAKDNADPKTGLEYGDHIGDGGFILKFADGTVTDATWKAKCFFKGPLARDIRDPKVEHLPLPDRWWAVDFDDSQWARATGYTEERVNPKAPYFEADFKGAKFIWTADLDLDNTVIFRARIERPGWTRRWNTKPDLDVTGAPAK